MAPNRRTRSELHSEGLVEVVVEIPRGSRNKYEQDDDGAIWFDRRIGGPTGFPGEYGYSSASTQRTAMRSTRWCSATSRRP
jgi:inorganic pyrophosphatase